jgi:hypothetical protein
MGLDNWVKCFQIGAYIAAIGGIGFTAIGYFKNNKLKRGEWLKTLFEKFYEREKFKEIRREIEYGSLEKYLMIDSGGKPTNIKNEEELVNYLNFFKFIAALLKYQQISQLEINDMFGYYLKSIRKNTFLSSYIKDLILRI